MLVIVDYGMGNLHSVLKAFKRIGTEAIISDSENDIKSADKLILPGVGNFKSGMSSIIRLGLDVILNKKVLEDKIPILGICLGMQLFTKHSEEGNTNGFGWIDAKTIKFNFEKNSLHKIPHMGWNNISLKKQDKIMTGISDENSFYFVHSYFVKCNSNDDILCTTHYGSEFVSSFQHNNITGMQFHPEKSHSAGLKILKNFCEG